MKRYLLLGLIWVFPCTVQAELNAVYAGARAIGLAGAYVAIADHAEASFLNPSGMPQIDRYVLTNSYSRLFGMKELARTSVSGVAPTSLGHFGLFYLSLGVSLYRVGTLGLSYGRTVGRRLNIGVTVRRLNMTIQNYEGASAMVADAGLLAHLPYKLNLGAIIHAAGRLSQSGLPMNNPRVVQVGISRSGERLTVAAQLDRHPRYGVTSRIGQELKLAEIITVRAGLSTGPTQFFTGFGLHKGYLRTDYALSSHPLLGLTHRFSLSMEFG